MQSTKVFRQVSIAVSRKISKSSPLAFAPKVDHNTKISPVWKERTLEVLDLVNEKNAEVIQNRRSRLTMVEKRFNYE
jgi:hypothetical protein